MPRRGAILPDAVHARPGMRRRSMSDVQRNEKEQVSRRQAAERLVDLAYALTTGGRLELTVEGEPVTVPLADELRLERNLRSKADHVELKLELSWSLLDAARRRRSPSPLRARAAGAAPTGGHRLAQSRLLGALTHPHRPRVRMTRCPSAAGRARAVQAAVRGRPPRRGRGPRAWRRCGAGAS